ncbi:hypothetical protein Vadar_015796 [Vaccinium darrowii]|uniref:Uncharacterized protein n=1 Tax=Vaccinium darrowii TaxID=229202 RepID=A0ACB7YN95_9ERIC|nr:hypothetical protein Vadar_015796 [Vaccinium darrowii]
MSRRRASGPAAPRKAKTTKQLYHHHPYQFCVFDQPLYTAHHLSVRQKRELGEDRISQLPTDIRVAILSRLTFQEAGRTRLLSRNWRHLWAFHTTRLTFDFMKLNFNPPFYPQISSAKCVSRVNEVLKLHQGALVDEFVIRFHIEEGTYSHDITTWVLFAFQKGVKRFELDLEGAMARRGEAWYAFPLQGIDHIARTARPAGFCCLMSLCLNRVNITGEVIENFLANCPLLEQLQVKLSHHLTNLRVAGSSLKLKSLEIYRCNHMDVLEISAVNLVSLTYVGRVIRMLLKNVPVLSEFCIGDDYSGSVIHRPRDHLSYLRQLESLKLSLPAIYVQRYIMFPETFPELSCLKQLELELGLGKAPGENLIYYTPLLLACPSLSKYTVRYRQASSVMNRNGTIARQDGYERVAPKWFQHRCLKVVEVVGFNGDADELEFLSYLLAIAVSLDKLIINPHSPWMFAMGIHKNSSRKEEVRKRARQLERELPPNVKLVLL